MKILLASLFLIFQSYQVFAFSIGTYNLHNMSDLEGLKSDLQSLKHISIFEARMLYFLSGNLNLSVYPFTKRWYSNKIPILDFKFKNISLIFQARTANKIMKTSYFILNIKSNPK
jgi:hypothetical protein